MVGVVAAGAAWGRYRHRNRNRGRNRNRSSELSALRASAQKITLLRRRKSVKAVLLRSRKSEEPRLRRGRREEAGRGRGGGRGCGGCSVGSVSASEASESGSQSQSQSLSKRPDARVACSRGLSPTAPRFLCLHDHASPARKFVLAGNVHVRVSTWLVEGEMWNVLSFTFHVHVDREVWGVRRWIVLRATPHAARGTWHVRRSHVLRST